MAEHCKLLAGKKRIDSHTVGTSLHSRICHKVGPTPLSQPTRMPPRGCVQKKLRRTGRWWR